MQVEFVFPVTCDGSYWERRTLVKVERLNLQVDVLPRKDERVKLGSFTFPVLEVVHLYAEGVKVVNFPEKIVRHMTEEEFKRHLDLYEKEGWVVQ